MEIESNHIKPAHSRIRTQRMPFVFRMFLLAFYLLSLGTFQNFAGIREVERLRPEFDILSAIKIFIRVTAFMLVAISLFGARSRRNWQLVKWHLFPLAIFGIWGAISTLWSPMPLYSFGHAMDLILLVMISALTALLCNTKIRLCKILFHLCTVNFLYLLLLIVFSIISPTSAQILRGNIESERILFSGSFDAASIVHFTTMAGVATLGLALIVASKLFWGWLWTRILFIPVLILNSLILFVSQTRSEIGASIVLVGTCFLLWGKGKLLATIILFCSLLGISLLLLDLKWDNVVVGKSAITYITRGQSKEVLMSLGNRTTVWSQVINALATSPISPIVGNGYSMPTPSGMILVEGTVRYYPPHNLLLHVVAGTGLIGAIFCIWGFCRLLRSLWRAYYQRSENGAQFLALLILFYVFLVGLIGNPIFGPINLKSVSIFIIIGMGIGGIQKAKYAVGASQKNQL